jgi:hypothetical protein
MRIEDPAAYVSRRMRRNRDHRDFLASSIPEEVYHDGRRQFRHFRTAKEHRVG